MGESLAEQERGLFYQRGTQQRRAEEQQASKEMFHTPLPEERSLMDGEENMNKSWDVGLSNTKAPSWMSIAAFLRTSAAGWACRRKPFRSKAEVFSWVC